MDTRKFTLEELTEQPSLIGTMNLEQIEQFKKDYYRKRIPIRKLLNEREHDIRAAISHNEKLNKLYGHIFSLYYRIQGALMQPGVENFIPNHGRSVGNTIHDITSIWSGLESKESVIRRANAKENGEKYDHCEEHFWPRQWAGETIMEAALMYKDKFDLCMLTKLLYKFCHVHRVTKEENRRLMEHQGVHVFESPEEAYARAGIELEQVGDYKHDPVFVELIEILHLSDCQP